MSEHVLVGAPVDQARQRLLAQVRRDGLHAPLRGRSPTGEGHGRGRGRGDDRKLTVRTLPSYLTGAVTVIPLRWYTSSTFDDRFPVVDANIELQQAEPGTCRLGLTGIYRPRTGQPPPAGTRTSPAAPSDDSWGDWQQFSPPSNVLSSGCSPVRAPMSVGRARTATLPPRDRVRHDQDDRLDRDDRGVERRDESAGGGGRAHRLKSRRARPLPGQHFPRVRETASPGRSIRGQPEQPSDSALAEKPRELSDDQEYRLVPPSPDHPSTSIAINGENRVAEAGARNRATRLPSRIRSPGASSHDADDADDRRRSSRH